MNKTLIITAILAVSGCSSTGTAADQDITLLKFASENANCAAYVASYKSTAKDIANNRVFTGSTTISTDGNKCTFTSNGIPNHDFNDGAKKFANDVSEQSSSFSVTATPKLAANITPLSIATDTAIFLNGVKLDLLAAACYGVGRDNLGTEKAGCNDTNGNPWRYDPLSEFNTFAVDSYDAHAQHDGTYHYHTAPPALYSSDCSASDAAPAVIGFAADGFPIYSSCFNDNGTVRQVKSSYVMKQGKRQDIPGFTTPDPAYVASANYDGQFLIDYAYTPGAGDLDQCNGMTIDGEYAYYATDSYPWVLGCFSGTPDESFNKRRR